MLHEQGYEVVGMTMKNMGLCLIRWYQERNRLLPVDSINDARNIAVELGFPHYILDIREELRLCGINHFTGEYLEGRTPNPLCDV